MLDSSTSIYKPRYSNKKSTTEEFIEKSKTVHGKEKYDYSKVDYKTAHNKVVIICPIHGEFNQTPSSHLSGRGCLKCKVDGDRSSTEQFIEKSKTVHGKEKYDYSKVDYINAHNKVVIICPIHGEFEQIPNNHLSGRGCSFCKAENQRRLNAIRFEDTYDVATIYLLKCYNDSEVFLKIGITSKTVDERYPTIERMPYKYETLFEWKGDSKTVVDMEHKIKSKFTYHKPEIMFGGGHTETLSISQEKAIMEFLTIL